MESIFAKAQRVLIVALVFFVVLAIFPLTPSPTVDLKILGYELGAFLALALWLFAPRPAAEKGQAYPALFWATVVFVALNFVAALASYNPGFSLGREFVSLASLFILFLVAADLFRTPGQTWVLIGA
ncbi:MAG: hypothetical protein RBU21_18995, partial [FCB group bacterium]|nr:hypothetical protein [FCB group bacterium]